MYSLAFISLQIFVDAFINPTAFSRSPTYVPTNTYIMAQQLTAVNANDHYCSFTLPNEIFQGGLPGEADICKDLESSDSKIKRQALKAAIMAMLGGEAMPRALMQVIRFCINSQDHQVRYW